MLLSPAALQDLQGYLPRIIERRAGPAAVKGDGLSDDSRALLLDEVVEEIPQIATRLQVSNVELYGKYDRLLAEASLRINIALPITFLLALIIWRAGLPLLQKLILTLLALTFSYFLMRQGFNKLIAARDVIIQSVVSIDEVASRRIDEWVERVKVAYGRDPLDPLDRSS